MVITSFYYKFLFRNEILHCLYMNPVIEISNQNEISVRNEDRVELIPEWTTSHPGFCVNK